MKTRLKKKWWEDRFLTLMIIPERTRRVYKLVLPFFLLKLCLVLVLLFAVLTSVLAIDYVQVLGKMAENKRLKGENFKLQQDIQLMGNRLDTMEYSLDRIRNYAKKLQLITGKGAGEAGPVPLKESEGMDALEDEFFRGPASKGKRSLFLSPKDEVPLSKQLDTLLAESAKTEILLSQLQDVFMLRRQLAYAMPTLFPLVGRVSSRFGLRRHPISGQYKRHTGVDVVAEPGTPVRCPADGVVSYSGIKSGYGKVVVIDHGYGIQTLFAHNSKFFVNEGSKVRRGETIALVGNTGASTAPHLHYEIRKNNNPIDPLAFASRLGY